MELSGQKSELSSSVPHNAQPAAAAAGSDGPALSATLDYSQFDHQLLRTLGCIKALNFRHIAFIGSKLDNIPSDLAYQVLWHMESSNANRVFRRLQKLCAQGFVLPWRSWSPDRILTGPPGRARPKRSGVFYILGREGRRWLRKKGGFTPMPGVVEELYLSSIPLAKWLTASSCALTLEYEGAKLVPPNEVWQDRLDVPAPRFRPDFVVLQKILTVFYIVDSPYGLRSEYFVSQVARGLHFLESNSRAVILTRTKETFKKFMLGMQSKCSSENRERILVGDIGTFMKQHGHCTVMNADSKQSML